MGGSEMALSDLFKQGKPVVLNFWAGLCPPCRIEMPDFQKFHDEYGDRVLLYGVDVGPFLGLGSRDDGRALLDELGVTYPNGTTFDNGVVSDYGVIGMPTTYFFAPDGRVIRKQTGLMTLGQMEEFTRKLLAAS